MPPLNFQPLPNPGPATHAKPARCRVNRKAFTAGTAIPLPNQAYNKKTPTVVAEVGEESISRYRIGTRNRSRIIHLALTGIKINFGVGNRIAN